MLIEKGNKQLVKICIALSQNHKKQLSNIKIPPGKREGVTDIYGERKNI